MPGYGQPVGWIGPNGEWMEGRIVTQGAESYIVRGPHKKIFAVRFADAKIMCRVKTSYALLDETRRQLKELATLYGSESMALAVAVERLHAEKHSLLAVE